MSPLTVVYSLQQDEYNECETSTLGGLIVCADRVSGVLGPGTAVTLRFETCDVLDSQAQGCIIGMRLLVVATQTLELAYHDSLLMYDIPGS